MRYHAGSYDGTGNETLAEQRRLRIERVAVVARAMRLVEKLAREGRL